MKELAETQAAPSPVGTLLAEESSLAMGPVEGPLGDPTRYGFRGVLGVGGMGQVELRNDERIGRDVAFKVSTGSGTRNRARFVREALLQARLEHPSFVPVYDIGIDGSGEHFFTMRRIKGRTLADVIAGHGASFTQRRLLGAFVQLCLAVDFAHARGVIHRDLKPANVMLGDFGEIYVLDWGIAKVLGESEDLPAIDGAKIATGDESRKATQEGTVLGTFGYMAPEQMRGQHATLDRRADVYALGTILFEVLTGEPLHRGNIAEMVVSTLERPAASARERSESVAPELDEIVRRATSPERDARYESARALAEVIERYLEGDRDQALRREQAETLAKGALAALDASQTHLARAEAGRSAVRALAFDPDNVVARRVLVDVVTVAPSTEPAEAAVSVREAQRLGGIALTRSYGAMLGAVCTFFALLLVVSGVIDWPLVLTMLSIAYAAVAVIAYGALVRGASGAWITFGFALLCIANGLFTRWVSPFVSVPLTMIVNTVAMTFYATARERVLRLAMAIAAVTIPVLLDLSGSVPTTFEVHSDRLVIFARAAAFPDWLPWVLAASTAAMLSSTLVVTYFLEHIASLQKRVHVQAWMLRQVVGTRD